MNVTQQERIERIHALNKRMKKAIDNFNGTDTIKDGPMSNVIQFADFSKKTKKKEKPTTTYQDSKDRIEAARKAENEKIVKGLKKK